MTGLVTSPHCVDGGFAGRHMEHRHVALHVFHYNDGIIDDNTYGEDETEECQEIYRKPEGEHTGKGSYQRHEYRD